MEKHGSRASILKPLLTVFLVTFISYLLYYGSRRIENQPVQQALARLNPRRVPAATPEEGPPLPPL